MSENAWKNELRKNIATARFSEISKDSLTGLFTWRLSDTSIQVKASFNNDGIQSGRLRVIYFNLNNKDGFSYNAHEINPIDTGQIETGFVNKPITQDTGFRVGFLPSDLFIDVCLKARLETVKSSLESLLGKPDSIRYEFENSKGSNWRVGIDGDSPKTSPYDSDSTSGKADTISFHYYYFNGNDVVYLMHSKLLERSKELPHLHYSKAFVLIYPKNYEIELNAEIESRRSKIKAKDLLKLEFYTSIERTRNSYGLEDVNFEFWAPVDPTCIKELSETRPIVAAKGTIRMTDSFGDILQDFEDFDFSLSYPIAQDRKPGLEYVTSTVYLTSSNGSRYQGRLNVFSKKCSEKLRQVILNNGKVNVDFIANSIKFSDGSILR